MTFDRDAVLARSDIAQHAPASAADLDHRVWPLGLSDSDRGALMGETLTRVYNWSPSKA